MAIEQQATFLDRRGPVIAPDGFSIEQGHAELVTLQGRIKKVIPQFTDAAVQFGELIDRRPVGRIVNDIGNGGVVQPLSWFMRGFMEATGKGSLPWIDLQTKTPGKKTSSSISAAKLVQTLKDDPRWPGPYEWGQQRVAVVTPTITSGETVNTVTRAIRQAMREDNGQIRAHPAIDIITTQLNDLDSLSTYEWDTVANNRERTIIDLEHRGIPLGSGGRVYASEQTDAQDPMGQLVNLLTGDKADDAMTNSDRTVGVDSLQMELAQAALYTAGIAAGVTYRTHDLHKMQTASERAVSGIFSGDLITMLSNSTDKI